MIVCFDIGNSKTSIALFQRSKIISKDSWATSFNISPQFILQRLNKFLEKQPSRTAKILLDLNSNQKLEISNFDASIRARYESINHGIEGFVHNNFLPNGVFNEVVRTYLFNPNRPLYEESQNIMSCIFLMLFEIGFLTVFFIFFVFNNINKYFNSLNDKIFFSIVSLIALVLPISPALPLFALLNAIWQNKKI